MFVVGSVKQFVPFDTPAADSIVPDAVPAIVEQRGPRREPRARQRRGLVEGEVGGEGDEGAACVREGAVVRVRGDGGGARD